MSKNSSNLNSSKTQKRKHTEMMRQTRSMSRSESLENSVSSKSSIISSAEVSLNEKKKTKNKKEENNPYKQEENSLNLSLLQQDKGKNSKGSREQSVKSSKASVTHTSNNITNNQNLTVYLDKGNIQEEDNSEEDEEEFYEVESIVSKRFYKGKPQYFVKWKGYPSEQNTWEPLENLSNVMELVENFEEIEKLFAGDKSKKKKTTASGSSSISNTYHKNTGLQTILETSEQPKKKKENLNYISDSKDLKNLNSNFNENIDSYNKKWSSSLQDNLSGARVPIKVLHARSQDGKLIFLMEWAPLSDGTVPKESIMSHEEIKRNHPYLLIEYYERRIRLIKSGEQVS